MSTQFWHVCYVKPKSEKIVFKKIGELNFEVFLPLIKHLKVYKNSKKQVYLPLFPSYIFLNIQAGFRHHITAIPEVYRFIKFGDEYAKVSDEEINNLKLFVKNVKDYNKIYSDIIFQQGKRVEIIDGPFKGVKGKMADKFGKNRIIIEIEAIKQAFSIEIDVNHLKVLKSARYPEPVCI